MKINNGIENDIIILKTVRDPYENNNFQRVMILIFC